MIECSLNNANTICKNLIIDFIDEYLNGNIDALKTFDFAELANDKKYGCPGRGFDCDDTNLIRAICFIVWENVLPELDFYQIETGKRYRGDTLNTFATLFGKKIGKNLYAGAEKFSDDDCFRASVDNFYKTYHTIGNFVLMPNIALETIKEDKIASSTTINLYRGTCSWRDYFDRFLLELKYCLTDDNKKDAVLTSLIERNRFYFYFFNFDLMEISRINFFDPYFTLNGEVCEFFAPYEYHWRNKSTPTEAQRTEYVNFANNYMSKAQEIINYRADKIINELKLKL